MDKDLFPKTNRVLEWLKYEAGEPIDVDHFTPDPFAVIADELKALRAEIHALRDEVVALRGAE